MELQVIQPIVYKGRLHLRGFNSEEEKDTMIKVGENSIRDN